MHSVVRGSIPNPKSQWPKFASRKQASNEFSAKIKNVEGQQDWFEASDLQVSALNKLPALGETRFYGFVNTHLSPKDFNAMVSCVRTHISVNLLSCSSSHHAQSWKLFPVRCPANQLMTHAATSWMPVDVRSIIHARRTMHLTRYNLRARARYLHAWTGSAT